MILKTVLQILGCKEKWMVMRLTPARGQSECAEGAGSWHVALPEPSFCDTCLKTSWGKAWIRKHTAIRDSQLFLGGNPTMKRTCLCTSVLGNTETECHFGS